MDRVAGLLGCPLRLPCRASESVGREPWAPSCRACCRAASARSGQKVEKVEVPAAVSTGPLTGTALSAAPLKGIPKQAPFRSPTTPSVFSPAGNRTPIPPSRTPLRKERGVKVGAPRRGGPRRAGWSAPCPVAEGGTLSVLAAA